MAYTLTITEYAKINGCSRTTIRKAIDAGKILSGFDPAVKMIDRKIADKEWGREFRAARKMAEKKENKRIAEIQSQIENAENTQQQISQKELDEIANLEMLEMQLDPHDSEHEARRKHRLIKAQIDLISLKVKAGELVNREDVDRELFEFGKEVRSAFQAIPARITKQLLSMDEKEAQNFLTDEINEVLMKLSNEDDLQSNTNRFSQGTET